MTEAGASSTRAAAPGGPDDLDALGGLDPEDLADRFGTPLYVYDLDGIERRVAALRAVLPPPLEVAYAVKANPALGVVAHLGSLGLGIDVASGGELATALRAGIEPERIVFTGPGKRDDELAGAVASRIRAVTVESPGELARLERIAAAAGRQAPVLLRAATTGSVPRAGFSLVGATGTGKFGMDEADLRAAAGRAVASRQLEPLGVHAFGASNVLDADALASHAAATVALARDVATDAGFPLRLVDIGGGLGIPYADGEAPLDLEVLGARLDSMAAEWAADPVTRETRVLLEPGRFLVGPAGIYLARVIDRKAVGGETVVIVDGGIHHLLRGALVGREHRVSGLGPRDAEPPRPVTIGGPLCTGLDILASTVEMPPPAVGDLVAVRDAGAYGLTESMLAFLSHPVPAEVAVRGGRAECIRPRRDPGSWLETQRIPDW